MRVGIWDKDCARKREKAGWVFDLRQPCQGRERRSRERERCEGEREQPFNKEGGGKGGEQSKRGHSPQGGAGEEATAKKSWKEGDDGED